MSHHDRQNSKNPAMVSRRKVLGILGGASALTCAERVDARQGGRTEERSGREEELSLDTRLVREYGLRYPIVSAGMAFVGLPELVTAVSN